MGAANQIIQNAGIKAAASPLLFDSNGNPISNHETWNGDGPPPAGQGWVYSARNGEYTRDTAPTADTMPQQLAKAFNKPVSEIQTVYRNVGSANSDKQTVGYYSHYDPKTDIVTNFDPNGNLLESGRRNPGMDLGVLGGVLSGVSGAGAGLNDLNKQGLLVPLMLAGAGGLAAAASTGGFAGLNAGIDLGSAGAASTSSSNLAATGGGNALTAAVGGNGAASAALTPAVGAGAGIGASAMPAGTSLGNIASATPTGAAVPAAGVSANQAVAAGMSPGAAGATGAAGLTAAQLAAAAGTTGAGSALNALATAGNASALTDALNSGSSGLTGLLNSAGSAIGNTLGNLSGTQLAALGTGAAGLYNASATREAMQQAIAATQAANASSQGTLGNIYNQQLGYQAPYQAAGVGAVNQLADMTPYLTHQFNAADLQAGLAPNYDFMLQQGQQANQRAANVGGGALGGNALTGLNQYTQNYASNAYQNAFNNYQNQRQNIYSNLAGIAGIGQTANTGAGTAGTNYGQGITNLNTSLANAQSANILGQAQVGAGGITNAANTAFLATLLGQNTPTAGTSQTGAAPAGGGTSISDFAKLLTGIKAFTG